MVSPTSSPLPLLPPGDDFEARLRLHIVLQIFLNVCPKVKTASGKGQKSLNYRDVCEGKDSPLVSSLWLAQGSPTALGLRFFLLPNHFVGPSPPVTAQPSRSSAHGHCYFEKQQQQQNNNFGERLCSLCYHFHSTLFLKSSLGAPNCCSISHEVQSHKFLLPTRPVGTSCGAPRAWRVGTWLRLLACSHEWRSWVTGTSCFI